MDIVYKELTDFFNLPETKARFTDNGLPELKQMDINLGQPDNPQGFELFYPAIFIDWEEIKPSENDPVNLNISFHVIQEAGAQTENFSNRIDKGLEYVRVLKKIQEVFTNFSASNTSGFKFAGKTPNITPYFRYHIIQFRCFIDQVGGIAYSEVELIDYDATYNIKEKEPAPPEGDIDIF
jgi:hypothetical protein